MTKRLRLDVKNLGNFIAQQDLERIFPEVMSAQELLVSKKGKGSDFLGWIDLPSKMNDDLLQDIDKTAKEMRQKSDMIIVIGIGGSYLGAKAAIDMLALPEDRKKIVFMGQNLSADDYEDILDTLNREDMDVCVNVISKSGTTTEPAVAFRIIENYMIKKYGRNNFKDRIICTTDAAKGALKKMADIDGYRTYVIPDDIGGRFSVLTPVGLLPVACAGINLKDLMSGARAAVDIYAVPDANENQAYKYAAVRNLLYRKGKAIEILSNFDARFHYVAEWWKQLFGESEGKNGKGLFPASCDFTTDLHSMGQLIQDGPRNIFETFMIEEKEDDLCAIPREDKDLDGLNYIAGKQVSYVNKQAYYATSQAHLEGGVPNMTIFIPERSAFCLGELFYFFEKSVAVSAYVLGVNPFDQPGVESYKNKMFKLLGKPGV